MDDLIILKHKDKQVRLPLLKQMLSKLNMMKNPDQEQGGRKLKKGRQLKGHTGNLQNSGGKVSSFRKDLVQHTLYHTYNCRGTTWKKTFSKNLLSIYTSL